MTERLETIVIGGGQAGLATSHELTRLGIEHVVLERGRVANTWRKRWDSFCWVSPNWFANLPGGVYDGDDPDGYLPRDEIVAYFEQYAASFEAPVREEVEVSRMARTDQGFVLETSRGELAAARVVVATGSYRKPHLPPGSEGFPPGLAQVPVESYRNPGALPDGKVLVIGGAQSGSQIAEELLEAGREVFCSMGRAAWAPRRIGGTDLFGWLTGEFLEQPVDALPAPGARLFSNPVATGHHGGHDLNALILRDRGAVLLGHFLGAEAKAARFAPDADASLTWGNERFDQLRDIFAREAERRGVPLPELPEPLVLGEPTPETIDLDGFGAVVHAGGFRPDYARWIDVPGVVDDLGFPAQRDGASTAAPGLYFVGVHFLRKRKSSLLWGVGEDAAIVAEAIAR